MSRPWMPLYVADYIRDTRKLTPAEHGAYLLLIMEYWTSGALPGDDRQLARIVGMTSGEWRRAKPTIQVFFGGDWKSHKRIDAELAKSAEISSKRSASAKLKHSKCSANADANAQHLDTHAGATTQPQSQKEETREVALSNGWGFNSPEEFWLQWPHKVGKPAAMKALVSARKRGASFEAIMAGIDSYIRDKPPDRPWLNPSTFLNQNRWEDQPATVTSNGKPKSQIIQAIDNICERVAGFDGPARVDNELRGPESKTPPRLLSHG